MNKISAGVVTGLVLGAAQGALTMGGDAKGAEILLPILGRASQGIIAGVLAAYLTKPKTPLWRGALVGVAVGAGLGFLAALPDHAWMPMVPASAGVGLCCGLAVAKAAR
ncbi:MAG TPA: hypothetical protein VFS09_03830 [Candidatus Eisenbacteria bacterium]|nr:hypothetical protein [Candidatus Eisenbacteria bacterium]